MSKQWFSVAGALTRQREVIEGGGVGLQVMNGFVWTETEIEAATTFETRIEALYPGFDLIGVSARAVPTEPPPPAPEGDAP